MRSASSTDRQLLQRWLKAPTTPQRVVRRSRIVLLAIDGMREQDIAAKVGVSRPTVRLWLARFDKLGVEGLLRDAPGRGRRSSLDPAQVRQKLAEGGLLNAEGKPVSLRRAAAFLGTSPSALVASVEEGAPVTTIGVESKWTKLICGELFQTPASVVIT